MPPQITRVKTVYLNGVALPTISASFNRGGATKEHVSGPSSIIGYRLKEFKPSSLKAKVGHTADLDIEAALDSESLVVAAELTDGKMVSFIDPQVMEPPDVGDDGTVEFNIEGTSTEDN
jgi:hypothetical protein